MGENKQDNRQDIEIYKSLKRLSVFIMAVTIITPAILMCVFGFKMVILYAPFAIIAMTFSDAYDDCARIIKELEDQDED